MKRKILAVFLAILVALGCVPVGAVPVVDFEGESGEAAEVAYADETV